MVSLKFSNEKLKIKIAIKDNKINFKRNMMIVRIKL